MSGFLTRRGAFYEISQSAAALGFLTFVLKVKLTLQFDDLFDYQVLQLIIV
ncbi:hypothetical protein [Sphingomonas sp.]|jgi:hypothetical protein|uniref:hypothetical protein n=1 Tax=Sphingomonas sp. TaxID=28214 RepID=UPI0035A98E5D